MSSLTKKSVQTKSASGIGVAPSLQSAFSSAKSGRSVRAIKVEIKNDAALVETQSFNRSGGWSSDFGKISTTFCDESKCCFVIAFKDNGSIVLASYVPGTASMKDKMVYSTSKGALLGLVGVDAEQYAATSKAEMSYDSYSKHSSVKAPLSLLEEQMREHETASAPLRHEPTRKNEQFSLIAKMAATSKTGGYAGAKAVKSSGPVPAYVPSPAAAAAIAATPKATPATVVSPKAALTKATPAAAAATAAPTAVPVTAASIAAGSSQPAKKWGGGTSTQPTAQKCAVAGCTQPRLGRGYCAAHASFANTGPSPAPGIKKQTTTPAAAATPAAATATATAPKADTKLEVKSAPAPAAAAADTKADAKTAAPAAPDTAATAAPTAPAAAPSAPDAAPSAPTAPAAVEAPAAPPAP